MLLIYASIKLCELDDFFTLCDFKLCDCIARKIFLTINFARLKFVRDLIMNLVYSDSHKTHK